MVKKTAKMIIVYGLFVTATGFAVVASADAICSDNRTEKLPLIPEIQRVPTRHFFYEGETLYFNCTANATNYPNVTLSWILPHDLIKDNVTIIEDTNVYPNLAGGYLYNNITILNAKNIHAGKYKCICNTCGHEESKQIKIRYSGLKVKFNHDANEFTTQPNKTLEASFEGYPNPTSGKNTFKFFKNGEELSNKTGKYEIGYNEFIGVAELKIYYLTIEDNANYTIVVTNGYEIKNATHQLQIHVNPLINFGTNETCVIGQNMTFRCDVSGYPLPDITWKFTNEQGKEHTLKNNTRLNSTHIYNETAYLDVLQCDTSGNLVCIATNSLGMEEAKKSVVIFETVNGFGIILNHEDNDDKINKTLYVVENELVSIKCIASIDIFSNVTWALNGSNSTVEYSKSNFSHEAILIIQSISLNDTEKYKCIGLKNGNNATDSVQINVDDRRLPTIDDPGTSKTYVYRNEPSTKLHCTARGAPRPQIIWKKDGMPLINEDNVKVNFTNLSRNSITSTVEINHMQEINKGKYECEANNTGDYYTPKKTLEVDLKVDTDPKLIIAMVVLIPILLAIVAYQTWRVREQNKKLEKAGITFFDEGKLDSIDPNKGLSEQAGFLPYDPSLEVSFEKIRLGIFLGDGEFGVVHKAEMTYDDSKQKVVAVKKPKDNKDLNHTRLLIFELKILMHIRSHINVVNLLGAWTEKKETGEILVILEFCELGCMKDYLERAIFKEQPAGEVNHAFAADSNGGRPSESSVSPQSKGSYYEVNTSMHELTLQDMIAWGYQIACGMDHLTKKKVVHGDLAARNVLLMKDPNNGTIILKICDFGLAQLKDTDRNNSDGNGDNTCNRILPPRNEIAIEVMEEYIFSIQSDVWSFGVVMWEIFTLAREVPYEGIESKHMCDYLKKGNRLKKPEHANETLYKIMLKCWQENPTLRPTFSELQETLGSFLPDNIRNYYIDLNRVNSAERPDQDYMQKVCSPEYSQVVARTNKKSYYVENSSDYDSTTICVIGGDNRASGLDSEYEGEREALLTSIEPGDHVKLQHLN